MLGLGEREPRVKKNTLRRDRLAWTIRRAQAWPRSGWRPGPADMRQSGPAIPARPKTWVDAGCPKRGLGDGRCRTSPFPPPPIVHLGCRVGDDGVRPQTTEVRDGPDNQS